MDQIKLWQEERKSIDLARSVAVDSQNNIWVVGRLSADLKGTTDDAPSSLIIEGYLSKIAPDGEILYTKYLANDNDFQPWKIAIDSADNIIISGFTKAKSIATSNAEYPTYNGNQDNFIQKYASNGTLLWSMYVGGSNKEYYGTIIIDDQDNIIFSSQTFSADMLIINGTYSTLSGETDIYNAKFSPDGKLLWSTYIGGSKSDNFPYLSLDNQGNILTLFSTQSLDLPNSTVINNTTLSQCEDQSTSNLTCWNGAVYSQNKNGDFNWGKYLVGSSFDSMLGIAVDKSDNIYIGGTSDSPDYPITGNARDEQFDPKYDGVITELDVQGNLLYSSYFGGGDGDFITHINLDSQNNLIAVGGTGSSDYPQINSSINKASLENGKWDLSVTKFDSENNVIFSFHYGSLYSEILWDNAFPWPSVSIDNEDNIIIVGGSMNLNFPIVTNDNIYPFRMGGDMDSYMIKLNPQGEILWSTLTIVITDPLLDFDGDGLSNQEEYDLCLDASICLDATNPDSDGDGMYDGWERDNRLTPNNPLDGAQDNDFDLLSNIEEFFANTDPNDPDSDDDGMPDGWEVSMNLDPTSDDANGDKDEDGLPNLWEWLYQLNATDSSDSLLDSDLDKLINLKEYEAQTDPNDADSDGDGLPDGWEVKYKLDPLGTNDWSRDPDGDLIPNFLEYRLGTNPKNPIEGRLLLLVIVSLVFIASRSRFRRKNRDKNAKSLGFLSFKDQQNASKAGFKTSTQRIEAKLNGFLNKETQKLLNANGISKESDIIKIWAKILEVSQDKYSVSLFKETEDLLSQVSTLEELHEIEPKIHEIFNNLTKNTAEITNLLGVEKKLLHMMKQDKVLVSVEISEINDILNLTNQVLFSHKKLHNDIGELLVEKQRWFEPWSGMLEFIQLTEDGKEIHISKIAEIMRCSIDHAEALLTSLLKQNSLIGIYNETEKTYAKGTNINDYLEKMLEHARKIDLDLEN